MSASSLVVAPQQALLADAAFLLKLANRALATATVTGARLMVQVHHLFVAVLILLIRCL